MIGGLVILAVVVASLPGWTNAKVIPVDKDLAVSQKLIYDLTWHPEVLEKFYPEEYKSDQSWANLEDHVESYSNPAAVHDFLALWKRGMLPRGRIFSVFYPEVLEEAISVFHLFYYAVDLPTFWKTVHWASSRINEQQFMYAFLVAVSHREDTHHLHLPPAWQIMPNYFFSSDVMKKVYDFKMLYPYHANVEKVESFNVLANYTNWYISESHHPEQKLTYFTEEIALNQFYFDFNIKFPFWMSSNKYGMSIEHRGELYYGLHKMLVNRYYLERLSQKLDEIEFLDWEKPIINGYTPNMAYDNGMQFPQRKHWSLVPVEHYDYVERIREYESRITAAIDSGYILTKEGKPEPIYNKDGIEVLSNLVAGNNDSMNWNFYGSIDHFARHLAGFAPVPQNPHQILPSAMENFATTLRDPVTYRIGQKIMNYFHRFKTNLGSYPHDEVAFPGVKIVSVETEDQVTYFEQANSLIDTLVMPNSNSWIPIKARQFHLNHKPYTYSITIESENVVMSSIRIFLGPKYHSNGNIIPDPFKYFYQIDYFVEELKQGKNVFERKSSDSPLLMHEHVDSVTLYKKYQKMIESGEKFPVEPMHNGFPQNLILPRGTVEGMEIQFIVHVSEYRGSNTHQPNSDMYSKHFREDRAVGYPLDRPFDKTNLTNMFLGSFKVYHKTESQLNLTV